MRGPIEWLVAPILLVLAPAVDGRGLGMMARMAARGKKKRKSKDWSKPGQDKCYARPRRRVPVSFCSRPTPHPLVG